MATSPFNKVKANIMIRIEKFNVRIVNTGDKYGLNDCLINTKAPMVEFYDSRYPHTQYGQFVSRYYVETLLGSYYPNGLCLDAGVDAWSVSADGMLQVIEFIEGATA
jgi:hypothetical protein